MQTIKHARIRSHAGRVVAATPHYPVFTIRRTAWGSKVRLTWRVATPLDADGNPAVHQWGRHAVRSGAAVKR